MKQFVSILTLVSLLIIVMVPVLEFMYHHSDEEAVAAHPPHAMVEKRTWVLLGFQRTG